MHSGKYFTLFLVIFLIAITGCSPEEQQYEADPQPLARELSPEAVAGLTWEVPENWEKSRELPMRVATFKTPGADADAGEGEVAIFYFGPGEGGSIEANVERWLNQFEQPDDRPTHEVAEQETIEVNTVPVTIVRTSGTYTAAAGPMAPSRDIRPGYKLIGAIADGPQGAVFFKFTGPEGTVENAEHEFMQLVQSIRRQKY